MAYSNYCYYYTMCALKGCFYEHKVHMLSNQLFDLKGRSFDSCVGYCRRDSSKSICSEFNLISLQRVFQDADLLLFLTE